MSVKLKTEEQENHRKLEKCIKQLNIVFWGFDGNNEKWTRDTDYILADNAELKQKQCCVCSSRQTAEETVSPDSNFGKSLQDIYKVSAR